MVQSPSQYSADAPAMLAPYACDSAQTQGRLYKEAEDPDRSAFQRDRDRIIHCTAFRRLEGKTQVFVPHENDHNRTRLTHSMEVAQLARDITRKLRLDEDLTEAISLAHDLGHTPFGHAGEEALAEKMEPYGGFDHNAQTIRILTQLEKKYAAFDGLNLTWECLEGIAKHNGPVTKNIPRALEKYNTQHDLELASWPGLEAQVAALCDDIAYINHDIEDGLRAELFAVEEVLNLPLAGDMFREVMEQYPELETGRLIYEARRRIINHMVLDMVQQTEQNIDELAVGSAKEIRDQSAALCGFSSDMQKKVKAIYAFLYDNMYMHETVQSKLRPAQSLVKELFDAYFAEPETLSKQWREQAVQGDEQVRAEVVSDFIAGMTDSYAMKKHAEVCR